MTYLIHDGRWVNEKFLHISEIINDYDPEFELCWIPPEARTSEDSLPYAVRHNPPNGNSYICFFLDESQLDERVLARMFAGDLNKNPNYLENIEAMEAAREALRLKEIMEAQEERKDLVASIVGSRKDTFRHNGKVIRIK